MPSHVAKGTYERQRYEVAWLEKCYEKVSFPNPKCEQFLAEFNDRLSNKIRSVKVNLC